MAPRGPRMVNLALALATTLACLLVLFTPFAGAVTLPAGFEQTTVISGLTRPQDVEIAPNGRVFVAEKTGIIKTYTSLTDTTPTVLADLGTQVHNYGSRGLMSIVAHPAFPAQPYVYVYYTLNAPKGGTPPVYLGGTRLFDGCPKTFFAQLGKDIDNCPAAPASRGSGRGRDHDRLRAGAGRGLLPAVRIPRRGRAGLRRGRQPVRDRQRRLHGAVLGLRSGGLSGQPLRRSAGWGGREPDAPDL